MDSLLCEDEAWTRQTGITAQECCNFWSFRWIVVKVLKKFSKAVFLGGLMESFLVVEEVWSRHTWITV
jgi:hypothetical protein